ncbi:MAG TPA: DUF2934 domain-containing protein, partial [Variovorax sp.]|nr:DUF2934 domain-containing protein [Variovorax sp.]
GSGVVRTTRFLQLAVRPNLKEKESIASKKKVPVVMSEPIASAADHPEHATEAPEPPPKAATSEDGHDREEQIRQAAYAAYERRGGTDGDAVQDWLDAEVQWEHSKT